MASVTDFPARGKILSLQDRTVVFAPVNTNYELRFDAAGDMAGAQVGVVIDVVLRVTARKLWTVPSGGNFVDPIFGPPRRIQGRVRYLEDDRMVVHAGVPIVVALPQDGNAFDLVRGPLAVGGLVNVSALPGATLELIGSAVGKA